MNLETAIDRFCLPKTPDFIGELGENTLTNLVRALQARLLVSRLPSVVAPPSSMKAASVEWDRGRDTFNIPLPPNRTCGFPAYGSPVESFLIGIGSLVIGL